MDYTESAFAEVLRGVPAPPIAVTLEDAANYGSTYYDKDSNETAILGIEARLNRYFLSSSGYRVELREYAQQQRAAFSRLMNLFEACMDYEDYQNRGEEEPESSIRIDVPLYARVANAFFETCEEDCLDYNVSVRFENDPAYQALDYSNRVRASNTLSARFQSREQQRRAAREAQAREELLPLWRQYVAGEISREEAQSACTTDDHWAVWSKLEDGRGSADGFSLATDMGDADLAAQIAAAIMGVAA